MAAASSHLSKTLRRMLVRTQALVDSGVIEQPKWLDAVRRSVTTLSSPLPSTAAVPRELARRQCRPTLAALL
jgi:hypothetical protein